jgi:PHD/YefM family antitoxin component YafN of YafNO toxin-antitoxin module
MTSPFQTYRTAFDQMNADPTVIQARQEHREAEAKLAELRAKHAEEERPLVEALADAEVAVCHWEGEYRNQMDDAAALIAQHVIAAGQSVQEFGVEAKYSNGRRSTEWKAVAQRMNAPQSLIDECTTPGKPSVQVRVI